LAQRVGHHFAAVLAAAAVQVAQVRIMLVVLAGRITQTHLRRLLQATHGLSLRVVVVRVVRLAAVTVRLVHRWVSVAAAAAPTTVRLAVTAATAALVLAVVVAEARTATVTEAQAETAETDKSRFGSSDEMA